ncbi:MAG: DUF4416 family protein [Spirochaetales bacterium]|nr:DUF4416 family protein [Spirochaetales bacterium]
MGSIGVFDREKLVVGVLFREPDAEAACLAALERAFGRVDYAGPPIAFTFTSYYDAELGTPIVRRFLAFERLVAPDGLADIKIITNNIEDDSAIGGRRRCNLDPGLLSLSRFVLASTKPGSHRVPLARGIYAEIELMYEHGAFRPVEWTYADYRSPAYLETFRAIREIYKGNLKAKGSM